MAYFPQGRNRGGGGDRQCYSNPNSRFQGRQSPGLVPLTEAYLSRDVASEPPTPIAIYPESHRPQSSQPDTGRAHEGDFAIHVSEDGALRIYEGDLELTNGWLMKSQKHQLSICFMHSFGKCIGRERNDPSTCQQIHVRQDLVQRLRQHYSFGPRRFFSRTVKANLPPALLAAISTAAKKDLCVRYLEYPAPMVQETKGLYSYELSYRKWLEAPGGFTEAFTNVSIPHCVAYALSGECCHGEHCEGIHANLRNAQVRDNVVVAALMVLSDEAEKKGARPAGVPRGGSPAPIASDEQPAAPQRLAAGTGGRSSPLQLDMSMPSFLTASEHCPTKSPSGKGSASVASPHSSPHHHNDNQAAQQNIPVIMSAAPPPFYGNGVMNQQQQQPQFVSTAMFSTPVYYVMLASPSISSPTTANPYLQSYAQGVPFQQNPTMMCTVPTMAVPLRSASPSSDGDAAENDKSLHSVLVAQSDPPFAAAEPLVAAADGASHQQQQQQFDVNAIYYTPENSTAFDGVSLRQPLHHPSGGNSLSPTSSHGSSYQNHSAPMSTAVLFPDASSLVHVIGEHQHHQQQQQHIPYLVTNGATSHQIPTNFFAAQGHHFGVQHPFMTTAPIQPFLQPQNFFVLPSQHQPKE